MRQASDIRNPSRALGLNGSQGAHGASCIFLVQRGWHVCGAVGDIVSGIEGKEV